jgi:copper chaperone
MESAILRIEGMHCDGCAATIKSLLERQAGVKAVNVSFTEGLARVLLDPRTTSRSALSTEIEKAGYRVTSADVS